MKIPHYIFYFLLGTQVHSAEDSLDFDGETLWVDNSLFHDIFRDKDSAFVDYDANIEEAKDSLQPSLKRSYQEESADNSINFIPDQTQDINDQTGTVSEPPLKRPHLIESPNDSSILVAPQTTENKGLSSTPILFGINHLNGLNNNIPINVSTNSMSAPHSSFTINNAPSQNNIQPPTPIVVLPPIQRAQENNHGKRNKTKQTYYHNQSILQIAQAHHDGKQDKKTRFRYTGQLIVMLCQEQKDINISNLCDKKNNLGDIFAALYLRGDAKLLWEKYLSLEDYEKHYSKKEKEASNRYLSQIAANDQKQHEIKIAALKISALLDNQFSIEKMESLGLALSANEQSNKGDFSYIITRIKEIMNMMKFVSMEQFKTKAVSNRKVNNAPRRKNRSSTPAISNSSILPSSPNPSMIRAVNNASNQNSRNSIPVRSTPPSNPAINKPLFFPKALEHHNGDQDFKTQLRYTGQLVAMLCQQCKNLDIDTIYYKKDNLGILFYALYLKGDANFLWEQYLYIEDFEKYYTRWGENFLCGYLNPRIEDNKTQNELKIAYLKISALLGNQFAIQKINEVKVTWNQDEERNKGNFSYILNLIREVISMMIFVPKEQIKLGIIYNKHSTPPSQTKLFYWTPKGNSDIYYDSYKILEIAEKHHEREEKKISHFLHTGRLIVELCRQYRDLSTSKSLTDESRDNLGNLFAALYLRGDAGLLWEAYLCIEDYERKYNENPLKVNRLYLSQKPAKDETQKIIKMTALRVAALLGNQIAIEKIQKLGLVLTNQEPKMKGDYTYMFGYIKHVMDMMKFVPEGEIRCGI